MSNGDFIDFGNMEESLREGGFNWGLGQDPGQLPDWPSSMNFGQEAAPFFGGWGAMFPTQPQPSWWDRIWSILQGTPGTPGRGEDPGQPARPGAMGTLLGLGLPAAGLASGIGGIIQSLAGGRPTTRQQLRSTVQAGPQQQALTSQLLAALQNLQGLSRNAQLEQAMSRMAAGELPISSDLTGQLTKAFGGTSAGMLEQAGQQARERGWQGSLGDLAMGAGSPQFSRSLSDLEHEVNQALIGTSMGLPMTAANLQGSLMGNAAMPFELGSGLLGQLQQFAGVQGGQDVRNIGQRFNLLSALPPLGQLMLGIGLMGGGRKTFQEQPSSSLAFG